MSTATHLIALCGLALIVYGMSLWSSAAGWVVGGVFVVIGAVLASKPPREGEEYRSDTG